MKKIAIMGHGVVGSGVAEIFFSNHDNIVRKTGGDIDIKYILDLREFPGLGYSDRFVKDFSLIEKDTEISVVVETMGGLKPAYDFVKACLESGKSVVTSNKELVAAKGAELLSVARKHNVNFLFEASVGGGIPIIRPLSQCLAANNICEIDGILNGTTNYILTQMIQNGVSFEDALKKAQELGYAERDPSADVLGKDACRKICILSAIAFGNHVYPECVHTEGITGITLADVECAKVWGGAIKLIASSKLLPSGKLAIETSPALVPFTSQLASVNDVFNAVFVRGDAVGDLLFCGRGAGKEPTASAVLSDVIEAVNLGGTGRMLFWDDEKPSTTENHENICHRFFLRLKNAYPYDVRRVFGEVTAIDSSLLPIDELALITSELSYAQLGEKLSALGANGASAESVIRVLDL